MVYEGVTVCPECGGELKPYDRVMRFVKTKNGKKDSLCIRRVKCNDCGRMHRELPLNLLPYVHYDKRIVEGVIEGIISSDDLEYENYPCELTMHRWIIRHEEV